MPEFDLMPKVELPSSQDKLIAPDRNWTWDLESMFADLAAWEREKGAVLREAQTVASEYRGTLTVYGERLINRDAGVRDKYLGFLQAAASMPVLPLSWFTAFGLKPQRTQRNTEVRTRIVRYPL